MASNKRIFISFAIEDATLRDFLVGQGKNSSTPFSFTDMSVKKPWDSEWKKNCRTKIKGCDGLIGIVTKNTRNADGQIWELKCAFEEGVPVLLIYGSNDPDKRPKLVPDVIKERRILNWTWDNIHNFIQRV